MRLTGKQKISLSAAGGYLLAWAVDPLLTVARLNIENFATDKGYGKVYESPIIAKIWNALMTVWEAFTGSWGLGLICGLLLFSFWDALRRLVLGGPAGQDSDLLAFPNGLYAGSFRISANKLETEHCLEIAVMGFNATGEPVKAALTKGAIKVELVQDKQLGEVKFTLPPATILRDRTNVDTIANLSELFVVIEQPVRPQQAELILKALNADGSARFLLDEFDIVIEATANAGRFVRLPIWQGASLKFERNRATSNRLSFVNVAATIGALSQ